MNSPTETDPATLLAELKTLYDAGRYVSAHTLAVAQRGSLADWTGGAAALVMGCRLAGNLGGDRLSRVLILRAARHLKFDPAATSKDHARVSLLLGYQIYGRRGPFAFRRFLQRPGVVTAFDRCGLDVLRADLLCLRAHIAAAYRDTDAAESLWQEAHQLTPARPWTWTERASLLVTADRFTEALEAAREALRLQPWHRPTLQSIAPILSLLGKDDEAATLLEDALDPAKGNVESAGVAAQLSEIYREMRRPADLLRCLDLFESFSPLIEEPGRQWVHSRRCEAHLQLNDLEGAAAAADSIASASRLYAKTAERLRQPDLAAARRVHLEVPFVRQHEKTCAPATLAALSQFWNRPADHAEIAREICYGGTFDHQERHWAETHSWVAREFRADWKSSLALLDAGIPFALATAWINSGHLQAVIGYDARRGTIIIRDPFERNHNETLGEEFFAHYAHCGPRAMAIVPADDPRRSAVLLAAELPEAGLHDNIYRLRRALHNHDRTTAREALAAMELDNLDARLTLLARRELAFYDGNDPGALAAVDGLLTAHAGEGRLRLEKYYILRRLARPGDAREWLEKCLADPRHSEPNLWRELARELFFDARQRPRAAQLLARALFYEPTEPQHLQTLAELRWDEGDRAESAALMRLAACAASVREDYWQHYFVASRHLRETDPALTLLEGRFRRLGGQSSQPGRTLFWARRQRDEHTRAAAVLAEALDRRPDDGELLAFAATAKARDGEHEKAAGLLVAAAGKAPPGNLARAAAEIADLRGDLAEALAHWREVLAREPLDPGAHRLVARLLAETDERGHAAAREHLDRAVENYPYSVALHSQRVEYLLTDPGRSSPEHRAAVDALLAVQPTNVWGHRERALSCEARGDLPAAFAALDEAERIDPLAGPTHAVRGRLHLTAGEYPEARASLRRALELDVDLTVALTALLEASPTAAEKRESLEFTRRELLRQPVAGDGLLAYRETAYPILTHDELQAHLDEALAARPDLWHAWAAVSRQHADAGRLDAARTHAAEATERFPLLPRVWVDLARAENLLGNDEAERTALERALRIRADYGDASRRLAIAHRRAGNFAEARAVLERAIAAAPLDVINRGSLAETLWLEDCALHGTLVLDMLTDIVGRAPGYEWAWDTLVERAALLGELARAEAAARLLTSTRPGEARSWMRLAHFLESDRNASLEARLDALAHALRLNPRLDEAYDMQARLLADAGRFDEALAACQPPAEIYPGGVRPVILEGRMAWIMKLRGDSKSARAKLHAVVADHPGYEWGWRMLAEWAEEAKDWRDALVSSERLAFLSPHAAPPLGYLADARLRLGLREPAKEALREAMRRDPKYAFAPITLFRVQMDGKDLAGAEGTLGFLMLNFPGPLALSRQVTLALARRDLASAGRAFDALARAVPASKAENGCLGEGVRAMLGARQGIPAERSLLEAMRLPPEKAHPEAGALWVRLRADRGAWRGTDKEILKLPDGELARRARVAFLTALGEFRQNTRVPGVVKSMAAFLRADTESWGQAGYAFTACGHHAQAVKWMRDWQARPDARPWMLLNLGMSLRVLAKHRDAMIANRHALTLPPDHTRPRHLAWVALDESFAENADAAQTAADYLAEAQQAPEPNAQPYRYLRALTKAVLDVRSAPEGQRRDVFRGVRTFLRKERHLAAGALAPSVKRAEWQARHRMARDRGLWWAKLVGTFILPSTKKAGDTGLKT